MKNKKKNLDKEISLVKAWPSAVAVIDAQTRLVSFSSKFQEFLPCEAYESLSISDALGVTSKVLIKEKSYIIGRDDKTYMVRCHPLEVPGSSYYVLMATLENMPESSSLELFAGTIAHDLNNILTGILGHVSFLRLSSPEGNSSSASLTAIEEGVKRAAGIISKVLDFSKADTASFAAVNLNELVISELGLLEKTLHDGIDLDRGELKNVLQPIFVRGDETQLAQSIANLIVNARDSMAKGGTLKVALSAEVLSAEEAINELGLNPGSYARLVIGDTGAGIPEEVKEKIFEPFFTTKEKDGTGLGLATVLKVVKSHGGTILFNSREGEGTTVELYLPVWEGVIPATEAKDPKTTKTPSGRERILIIDDEETVRMIMQKSLEHLGYSVDIAEDGVKGLEVFSKATPGYDLVILDMVMPKLSGDEVFFKLRELSDSIPVLIASGYSSGDRTERVLKGGANGYIKKPFVINELACAVRECLDGPT